MRMTQDVMTACQESSKSCWQWTSDTKLVTADDALREHLMA